MPDIDLPDQDPHIVALNPDIRRDLREHALSSLYVMAKVVLGYPDLTEACHGPLCEFLDLNPARFKLVLYPRDHFKSTVGSIARPIQKVCRNTHERILLSNETGPNAERFVGAIKQHAEVGSVFRTLFSDIIPKDFSKVTWSNAQLDFNNKGHLPGPTIDSMGMTGAMTSRHYTHVVFDDPIAEESVQSPSTMANTITRMSKVLSLFVKPETNTFDLIGTRWAYNDVYSFFMEKYGDRLARFVRGAIEHGKPIFPELISLETLALARETYGEYAYSCMYQNNPRNSAVQDFNVQDLKFYRWVGMTDSIALLNRAGAGVERVIDVADLDITITVDLAVAEKITSDRNALVVVGTTSEGEALVLEIVASRCSPLEVIEHIFRLCEHWEPRVVGIEGVAYQKAFKYFLMAECERRGQYINIRELKALGKKETRIRGLQPICATGRLYIDPVMHALRDEFSDFPMGKHDDIIDALSMQTQLWHGVLNPQRMAQYKAEEDLLVQRLRRESVGHTRDVRDPDDDIDYVPVQWREYPLF